MARGWMDRGNRLLHSTTRQDAYWAFNEDNDVVYSIVIWEITHNLKKFATVQRSAKRMVRGSEKFHPALALPGSAWLLLTQNLHSF